MVSVCFYFQVHQPFRLRKYSLFDIGNDQHYFDMTKNIEVMDKVAKKCYLPMNQLLLDLIQKHKGRFKVSFSVTGTALEQLEQFSPKALESFQALADTGCVEFLSETYHHSLSSLYSKEEFQDQVALHRKRIKTLFHQTPRVFRNTELVYNNELGRLAEDMGYDAILAEGADHVLGWRSPNFLYRPKGCSRIKLLLKNYRLSDDIAFRFSNKGWGEWPLTVPKYASWINAVNGNGQVMDLFMDYETFGEHQWADTGIFRFMQDLPKELLKHPDNDFKTVSEAAAAYEPVAELDIPHPVSWADLERDLSAWTGNKIQQAAIRQLYDLEPEVKRTKNQQLIELWRKLTTSDHFYYMCTKWFADGDVHKYFNPYDNPYDGFITFMNVLNDLILRVKEKQGEKPSGAGNLIFPTEIQTSIIEQHRT